MELIKNTIGNILRQVEAKKNEVEKENPEQLLKKIFTKKELRHIKFNYLHKGRLGLLVDSATWLYVMSLQKEEIIKKIHDNGGTAQDIYFSVGKW